MKNIVRIARSIFYSPVSIFPKIGLPLGLALFLTRQITRIDAPLRRYLLRGSHAL